MASDPSGPCSNFVRYEEDEGHLAPHLCSWCDWPTWVHPIFVEELQKGKEEELEVTLKVVLKTFGKKSEHDKKLAYSVAKAIDICLQKQAEVYLVENGAFEKVTFDRFDDDGHFPYRDRPKPTNQQSK